MDVVRATNPQSNRTLLIVGVLAVMLVAATIALARLRPASAPVDRATVVIDTVRRGPMLREVHANGTLVPESVRLIPAATDARVERVVIQPGTAVTADTVIIELSDPQAQQSALDAQWQLRAAEASYEAQRAQLDDERLDREASTARLRSEAVQARLRANADAELERQGLAANITRKISQSSAEELEHRVTLDEQRLQSLRASKSARLAALSAEVEQRRAMFDLRRQQTAGLEVRAGIDGVLQQILVQEGQRVTSGATLARVAQPHRLKAEVRVPETQAKDIVLGLRATVDTRNGIVDAHVTRIDPAVRDGSVAVDLAADGPLPAGARPDLSVDATIQLERLADVVYVSRPVTAQEMSSGTLFKVLGNGSAVKVHVDFGRSSSSTIEIRKGLSPGDQIIVSDTQSFDNYEQVNLK